ncbi:tyrosine-type recombinase/integrase [Brevundimonas sp.]|uniref:tyrosine-type recombinase/integrase n=1 Tax=Brevundimonas sp. TaxID=1871086 RepID=UPI003D6C9BA6
MTKTNSKAVSLTDRSVRALKAKPGERLELWDAEVRGLSIRVSDRGKRWVYRYRRLDGSQPRVTLGDYAPPGSSAGDLAALGVAGARARARKLRTEIDDGGDPAGAKALARAEAQAETIRTTSDLATEYFAACERGEYRPSKRRVQKRPATLKNERWMWKKHLEPSIGSIRVETLSRDAVKKCLRKLLDEGKGVMANRVRGLLQSMYAWAKVEGRTDINPAASIAPMAEEKPRTRVISDDELRTIWKALEDVSELRTPAGEKVSVGRPVRIAMQLCFLTMQRRAEIATMRVADLDLERAIWTIPADHTKSGRGHVVPLAPAAIRLIREALQLAEFEGRSTEAHKAPSPFVFPGRVDPQKWAIHPSSLTQAMRDIRAAVGIPDVTVHDARRLGATLMCGDRIRMSPYTAGLVLNHSSERGGAAAVTLSTYVHADTTNEKRRALVALEALILSIVETSPSGAETAR